MNIADLVDPFRLPCASSAKDAPDVSCVYFLLNGSTVFYVGAAKTLKGRLKDHHVLSMNPQLRITYIECPIDALLSLESQLIARFRPEGNSVYPTLGIAGQTSGTGHRLCCVCQVPLHHNNKSGYCTLHAEHRPSRKNRKTAKFRNPIDGDTLG